MKRVTYLLLISIFCQLVLSSCNDNDNDKVNPIVGTWTLTSSTQVDCDNPDNEGTETYTCTSTDCQKVTFTTDGKYTDEEIVGGVTETQNGTYTLSGNQIITCDATDDCGVVTYTVSGDTLTITLRDAGCDQTLVLKK